MSNQSQSNESPLQSVRRLTRRLWADLISVYCANTLFWRYLKSGALVWGGLMLWAFSNLVLSYRPDWTFMYYLLSYGFVLILWGPLTHLVVVPLIIRLRRTADSPLARTFTRHGSKINITVFLAIVIILGAMPLGVMTLDFQTVAGGDDDSPTPDPELVCTSPEEGILHCELSDDEGYDHVVVMTGGDEVKTIHDPPYAFEIDESELEEESAGYKRFVVELRDEDGELLKRYIQRADQISESSES